MIFRKAVIDDIDRCICIRANTRDNAYSKFDLEDIGVTKETWTSAIENGEIVGYVCTVDDLLIGYCFGDYANGEITVLAILAGYEGHQYQFPEFLVELEAGAEYEFTCIGSKKDKPKLIEKLTRMSN